MPKLFENEKELVAAIEHHYASDSTARGCMYQWIRRGTVPGVHFRKEGRLLGVFPDGPPTKEANECWS